MDGKNNKMKIFILFLFSIAFTLIIYLFFLNSLENPKFNSIELLPEEAFIIVLHEVFEYPMSEINNITFNDVKDRFSYQYVMVRGNGSVYLLDQDSRSAIKAISNTTPPITKGIHYAWEITTNNTKIYVDSTSGQIVSSSKKT
ncbi:MAG TPA: hypothetical protein VER14_09215 [Phototrophicaceae bacterium]|nr:hypothetical protein [Phototrophicaceae bacterium]